MAKHRGHNLSWSHLPLLLAGLAAPVHGMTNASNDAFELPLVDAINHGLQFNRQVMLADLTAAEAGIGVRESLAEFTVRWGPEGSVSTSADEDILAYGLQARRSFMTGGEVGVSGGMTSTEGDETAYVRIDVRQPLLRRAGALINREPVTRAEQSELDARRSFHLRRMEMVIDVVRSYESVLRYERQVEVDGKALERLNELLTLTRAREETGGAGRLDTLRVELQRGEAETALEGSRELLALERDDFFQLIGWTQSTDVAFTPAPLLAMEIPDPRAAVATAFSNRLDYARALDQLDTAERQIRIAGKELQPDVSVIGNYRMRGGEEDRSSTDLTEEAWFAGLTIEPDLNRYEKRAGLLRARSQRDQVLISLADLDHTIERDVKQQIRAYHRAAADYRISSRNTELAWKRLSLAESMFRMGQGDNFSVTDAEAAHAAAVSAELAARAEASLSGYRLLNALGTLLDVPDELKPEK